MDSRHGAVRAYRTAGWLLAAMVAIPAITAANQPSPASFPPWTLKLAIHYLPPPTNRSQYGVVLRRDLSVDERGTQLLREQIRSGANLAEEIK